MEAIIYLLVSCKYVVVILSLLKISISQICFLTIWYVQTAELHGGFRMSHVTSSCRCGGLVQKDMFVILT